MPSKLDKIPINDKTLDRRVKLTDDDKELIKWLREEEELSYQKLADRFGVSKRTIIFIVKPETLVQSNLKRAERGGSKIYYDKEKQRVAIADHRAYKKELNNKGLLKK